MLKLRDINESDIFNFAIINSRFLIVFLFFYFISKIRAKYPLYIYWMISVIEVTPEYLTQLLVTQDFHRNYTTALSPLLPVTN